LHSISSNEQPVGNHGISSEPIENGLQQPFQIFHDPIANVLDDVYSSNPSPLTTCDLETCVDINLIRQLVSLLFSAFVHTPIPCKIPDQYKPLILPSVLHAFPAKYYIYLPSFDGECNNVNIEQRVQNVETFLDLFEVDEEDVSIRLFALSLQGKVKS